MFLKAAADKSRGLNLDIYGWLRTIRLEQYAQTFRDNAIDADVLRDLTDEHLRELDLPLGARLKILRAIAALGNDEQPPASPEITPALPRTDARAPSSHRDVLRPRRFDSALGAARPRGYARDHRRLSRSCAELIDQVGGFVAKYMGDGVLVYFGYPQAHEDDAERAVRAGLALVEAVPKLKTAPAPASSASRHRDRARRGRRSHRIGRGAGARHRRRDAEPCGAPARYRQAGYGGDRRGHTKTARQSVRASGLSGRWTSRASPGRSRAWAALRRASVESRFEALHATGLTALVGQGRRNRMCCFGAGREQRPAKARWCCFPARPASANRGSRPRCWSASPPSRTRGCVISARRSTPTAHFIRSSARWNERPDWRTTTQPQAKLDKLDAMLAQTSTSSDGRRAFCRDAVAAERRALSRARPCPGAAPAENTGSAYRPNGGAGTPKSRVDDLRGCALDRPHEPGGLRSGGGPDTDTSRAADRNVPAGVRGAMDRTTACDCSHAQSVGAARRRRHDRPRRREQSHAGEPSARISSSAPTEFPSSSRR